MNNRLSKTLSPLQARLAAIWWARFLPSNNPQLINHLISQLNVEFSTNQSFSECFNIAPNDYISNLAPIPEKNILDFVNILASELRQRDTDILFKDQSTSAVINQALHQADINKQAENPGSVFFPNKTKMYLHSSGIISIQFYPFQRLPHHTVPSEYKNELIECKINIITNPDIKEYTHSTFAATPSEYSEIAVYKFRIIDVPAADPQATSPKGMMLFSKPLKRAKVYLKDYKGSEKAFVKMSDIVLATTIINPSIFTSHFKGKIPVKYATKTEELLNNISLNHAGIMTAQRIGKNLYQYTTGPVKMMRATQAGIIGFGADIQLVAPNDLLFMREKDNGLYYLSATTQPFFVECPYNPPTHSDEDEIESYRTVAFGKL